VFVFHWNTNECCMNKKTNKDFKVKNFANFMLKGNIHFNWRWKMLSVTLAKQCKTGALVDQLITVAQTVKSQSISVCLTDRHCHNVYPLYLLYGCDRYVNSIVKSTNLTLWHCITSRVRKCPGKVRKTNTLACDQNKSL